MRTLESADKMASQEVPGRCVPVELTREAQAGLVFISCEMLPEIFLAVKSDEEIRGAIDFGLRNAFCKEGRQVRVYTNGSITEPKIHAFVHLIDA